MLVVEHDRLIGEEEIYRSSIFNAEDLAGGERVSKFKKN
jgi:hypothetical protein